MEWGFVVLLSGVKMLADRPNRDGLRRPVTGVTDGVYPRGTSNIFMVMLWSWVLLSYGVG